MHPSLNFLTHLKVCDADQFISYSNASQRELFSHLKVCNTQQTISYLNASLSELFSHLKVGDAHGERFSPFILSSELTRDLNSFYQFTYFTFRCVANSHFCTTISRTTCTPTYLPTNPPLLLLD